MLAASLSSTGQTTSSPTSMEDPSRGFNPREQRLKQGEHENDEDASGNYSRVFEHMSIKLDEAVGSASISPSGRDVCLAARKGLFIVDLDDAWATPRFLPYYSDIVADVQWSPHPARAQWVVSTAGPKALVWNLAISQSNSSSTGTGNAPSASSSASAGNPNIEHICLGHERSITDINWAVFNVDVLATCGIDGQVLCFDLRQKSHGSNCGPAIKYSGWRYGATQVKYNRQNPNELASSHGEYLYIWDDRRGSAPVTVIRAHEQKIYGIDYSRRTKDSIVTCSLDSTVKYWHLDGSAEISDPTNVIQTSSPVWRARHTPFGNGIVTLPQRSEFAVKMWSPESPSRPVATLCAEHTDVVREFLWRTKGGNNADDDDREFQLVTWGSDKQLLLTPISHSVTALVGHVPHSPIEVRQTRRNAGNRSFRDPHALSVNISPTQINQEASPTDARGSSSFFVSSATSASSAASLQQQQQQHRMTPPVAIPARMPLGSVRYGRHVGSASANTGSYSSTGNSPQFGTSPADMRLGSYTSTYPSSGGGHVGSGRGSESGLADFHHHQQQQPQQGGKRGLIAVKSSVHLAAQHNLAAIGSGMMPPTVGRAGAGAFMTRNTGRRPEGHDAISWLENVRIVSSGNNNDEGGGGRPQRSEERNELMMYGMQDTASSAGDRERDTAPLHEEVTAVARAFETRVRFEKIVIPNRTVTVALYGPWATSGLSVFLRAILTFPKQYPEKPLSLDIQRSSGISNKARAKLLTAVRGIAYRYAVKGRNSLEACLVCLLGGKVPDPDDILVHHDEGESTIFGDSMDTSTTNHLLVRNIDEDEEDDDLSQDEDLERLLANRNCPPPRRCGAVFSPTGKLFAFFPTDPLQHSIVQEKRQRSVSPPSRGRADKSRRRRLFESFGVIPGLRDREVHNSLTDDPTIHDDLEEDSDEVLNIPSLIMARRRPSLTHSDSIGTSRQFGSHYAGTGRAFNSRVCVHDFEHLPGVRPLIPTEHGMQGSLVQVIRRNAAALSQDKKASWLAKHLWDALMAIVRCESATHDSLYEQLDNDGKAFPRKVNLASRPLFLGEAMPERLLLDALDVFLAVKDVSMLGMLACVVELDRRVWQHAKPVSPRRFSRSPGQSGAQDYFSIRPSRSFRSTDSLLRHTTDRHSTPGSGGGGSGGGGGGNIAHGSGGVLGGAQSHSLQPLKSPKDWLMSSSYGTQASSGGSSTRGSSWANNLSTFFRAGKSTPPATTPGAATDASGGSQAKLSPGNISPAFVKRTTAITPLKEIRRAGGIASNRPAPSSAGMTSITKSRSATHVSFAASATLAEEEGQEDDYERRQSNDYHPQDGDDDDDARSGRSTSGLPLSGLASRKGGQIKQGKQQIKITVRQVHPPQALGYRSQLMDPQLQAQLEYYRLAYSELLHRLQRPLERTQVIKLCRASTFARGSGGNSAAAASHGKASSARFSAPDGGGSSGSVNDGNRLARQLLHSYSGLADPLERSLMLDAACPQCGSLLSGRSPAFCGSCQMRQRPSPCSICHLPLRGLTETCLTCLHSTHLTCLQEWREESSACPAACGCECTTAGSTDASAAISPDLLGSFRSPPLIT